MTFALIAWGVGGALWLWWSGRERGLKGQTSLAYLLFDAAMAGTWPVSVPVFFVILAATGLLKNDDVPRGITIPESARGIPETPN